ASSGGAIRSPTSRLMCTAIPRSGGGSQPPTASRIRSTCRPVPSSLCRGPEPRMAHARRDRPLVPSFSVKLNNRPMLPDMAMWVANVVVEDEVDLPGMFALELVSKVTEKHTTSWADEAQLGLGAPVEVSF